MTKVDVSENDGGERAGFVLDNERARRRVLATLNGQIRGGGLSATAVDSRSWGALVWEQVEFGQPKVRCVGVVAPGLAGAKRCLVRRGLPAVTVNGVAGYRLPYPVSVWFMVGMTMVFLAALSWYGGSEAWKADLMAAAIPAVWCSVGVVVRARSGLLRRVDDPAHLEVLGRIEEALIARGDTNDGVPFRAPSVNEIWWSAAGSRQGAAAIAQELEQLVGQRECQSALSSSQAEQSIETAVGECQRLTADLWDRFYRVVEAHRLYETDIEKILAAPQLSDLNHPKTRVFVTALVEAQDALQGLAAGVVTAADAVAAVQDLELSWMRAEQSAAQARLSGFAADEQTSLRRAADLMRQALHDSSSAAERQDCYRTAMELLDGLIDVPAHFQPPTP